MSHLASPPRVELRHLPGLDPDLTPRKPSRPAATRSELLPPLLQNSQCKPAGLVPSFAQAPCHTLGPLRFDGESLSVSRPPSPTLTFGLPDVDFVSGSEISDSETDPCSSGVSQRGGAYRPSWKATRTDGYSSENSACVGSEDDGNGDLPSDSTQPRITFQEATSTRLRASSIGDGRRLCRVPSPSPLSQAAAPQAEAEPVRSWSRSLSLFKKKRSAPDLRTLADEHGRSDGPAALPPLPSVGRGRFVRAFSTAPAATDEKSVPALLSPLVPPRPRQALKTKASLQSLRSRSPFRPQTPSSPPPPTPPPLPLDVDPFAFLPIATRSTSPHPAASARRARPVRLSKDADGPYAARPRSHTSPSSVAPPSNVLSLLIPPEPLPSSFQLVLPSPKQLLAPLSSPVTPLSDASDERQRDERGRSRSYGGDTSDRAPPPPGPNRALTGPRRPLPPARRDGDDGEDRRPPHRRAAVNEFGAEASTSSSSSDSSGSDSDESESDFRTPLETTPDDDDVPLAVAHPTTALAAQKSLRLDRRKEKSAERSRRKAERRRVDSPPSRRRTGPGTSNLSLPQEPRRQAKDLPSAYGVASMDGVFRAEDLERKLRDLERAASLRPGLDGDGGPSLPRSRMDSTTLSPHQAGSASVDRIKGSSMPPPTLSRKASAANIALAPPVLSRKASATSIGLASTLPPLPGQSSLSRARSQSAIKPKVPQPPARGVRQVSATRPHSPTHEPAAAAMQRKGSEPLSGAAGRHRSLSSAARRPSTNPADVPPLPPLPGSSTNFPSPNLASGNTQQSSAAMSRRPTLSGLGPVPELDRLRIASQPSRLLTVSLEHGDVARTMRIDVPDSTTAGGLLELLKAKGELPTGRSGENLLKGELAVWERGDEWAVERPLRDYEVLSQVLAGWNPAKRENSFVIKRCSLCECLTLRAIPNQCPNVVGWVQIYSSRKRKWSKRYLEVRGGGVSLAKNERSKDEQHLCTLTAYDFYLVTRVPAKAPKGSYFALKSQDQSAFFEDASDFIHLFATDSRTFDRMFRGILDARSHSLLTANPSLLPVLSPTSAGSRGPLSAGSPAMADLAAFGAGPHGSIRRPSAGNAAQASVSPVSKTHDGLWQQGSLLSKMTRGER